MITPDEFPYIKSLYVNDCYAYRDFNIELHDYKPFSHLILTGKNGSGKSTILRAIHRQFFPTNVSIIGTATNTTRTGDVVNVNKSVSLGSYSIPQVVVSFLTIHKINNDTGGDRLMKPDEIFKHYRDKIYSHFEAKRDYSRQEIKGPSKELDFAKSLNSEDSTKVFINNFKQYLVNKKIDQAFAQIEQKTEFVANTERFFEVFRLKLSDMFEQDIKTIEFDRNNRYEFYLHLADGRKITFDMLPEGFSALLSMLMDLSMRVDLIRKQVNDYSYDPCGIVLIDEPETHLHLQLQEQVLPLLTSLFPNVQFIAATHSPAVIASIKQATIFDLTTKESRDSEETAGRSYSDLMMSHFGLENEYSGLADEIIEKVDRAVAEFGDDPARLRAVLQPIYDENSAYLSPTLKVKFELLLAEREAKFVAHS